MRYDLIDGRPVPKRYGPMMRRVKARSGSTLTSALRTQDAVNWARAQGATLSSQQELYNGFIQGRPGFNPANPPGYSTHELRSDGVAYNIPRGLPIPLWAFGQDWGNSSGANAAVRAFAAEGFTAAVTYPGNPRELHHVNLRRMPPKWLIKRLKPWKRGMKGRYVRRLKWKLSVIRDPDTRKPYFDWPGKDNVTGKFNEKLETAVKRFQRDHGQAADGVVGIQTKRQIAASYKHWKDR
jgi:peptidoglycan hydrolase-like protein with peptidoglycan-binding domain